MEWIDLLNQSIQYIEDHLTGELEYEALAKIACCSSYHYQRMFSYLAGVPLSEYIRRRKMSLAAADLRAGDKVVDVALRYGYESPTAFNRAFQSIHGLSPSAARREGAMLKAYSPIRFILTVKGEMEMNYRIVSKEAFRIVGPRDPLIMDAEESFQRVPQFWAEAGQRVPELLPLMDAEPKGVLGVCTCHEQGDNWYYIAVASSQKPPEGMYEEIIPACTWAVFDGQGPMPGAIQELQRRIVAEWLPDSGYEWAHAPDIEVYLNADPLNAQFEVWLPVVKKG